LIRVARLSDLEQIIVIEDESFLTPWLKSAFINEIQSKTARNYVFDDNETVKGYIFCWYIRNEIYVNNIAVSLESRRKGIARKMISYIKSKFSNQAEKMHLEVKSTNIPAIEFYKSEKFYYTSTRKKYYSDGSDALLLTYDMR
tara:strand:- start:113 stop:541 length:429 start_codon:yes stop_codon:yes gene_type:complete